MDTFLDLGLHQVITTPTRGDSILDLFLTPDPDLIESTDVVAGIGDHDIVKVTTRIEARRKKPTSRKILLWKKADLVKISNEARKANDRLLSRSCTENINDLWSDYKSDLLEILNTHVPSKFTSTRNHQPWITTTTKRLLRKKTKIV